MIGKLRSVTNCDGRLLVNAKLTPPKDDDNPLLQVLCPWRVVCIWPNAELKSGAAPLSDEGKLIHLSGEVTTAESLTDPMFAGVQSAIRLTRDVEMDQWQEDPKSETHKKLGGGTETQTTYSYNPVWSAEPIPSSEFKQATEHQNSSMTIAKLSVTHAEKVTLGKFVVSPTMVEKLPGDQLLSLTAADLKNLPTNLQAKVKCEGDAF